MSRGNSLIAGVVLIGLLGTLSVALQASSPTLEQEPQVAMVAVSARSQVAAADASEAKVAFTGKELCTDPVKLDAKASGTSVKGADKIKGEAEACVPGCTYKLMTTTSKSGSVTTVNAEKDDCERFKGNTGALAACRQEKECIIFECNASSGKCEKVKEGLQATMQTLYKEPDDEAARAKQLADYAKTNPIAAQNQALRESSELQKWFAEDVDKQIKDNADEIKAYKDTPEEASRVSDLKTQNENLSKINTKALAEGNTAMVAPKSPEKETPDCPAPCKKGPDTPPDPGPRQPPGTFPPAGQGGPPGSPGGQQQCAGISQMIGLCKPNQNQNQNPYQQCSPQYFCINSTLYWGSPQNQQQNYQQYGYGQNCTNQVVQYCQYGCQGVGSASNPTYYVTNPSGQSTQCAQNPQQTGTAPTATVSCGASTVLYDVGMQVPITYSCTNATSVTASGFTITNTSQTSGSATATVQKPPAGSDMVRYGVTCTGANGQTGTAQCDAKINVTSIVMVANPKKVDAGEDATIGWITKGMDACVISSPELEEFTEENADITTTSGTAQTPALSEDAEFFLTCVTKGGQIKESKVKVTVDGGATTAAEDD